jgi:hypothetical protein
VPPRIPPINQSGWETGGVPTTLCGVLKQALASVTIAHRRQTTLCLSVRSCIATFSWIRKHAVVTFVMCLQARPNSIIRSFIHAHNICRASQPRVCRARWRCTSGCLNIGNGCCYGLFGIFLSGSESLMNFNRAVGHGKGRDSPVTTGEGTAALPSKL